MRGNKGAFYCHLLPFITTYCHKTAKNVLVFAISIDYLTYTDIDRHIYG